MVLERAYRDGIDYYVERAQGLLASAQDGTPSALERFTRWDAALDAEGAMTVVARQHGAESWEALCRHVATLAQRAPPFAAAYRAIEAHDVEGLRAQLERHPALIEDVGTNGNDLLGLAAATCDERLVKLLLDRGADPARANAHGWTALHQAAYSGHVPLATMLIAAGSPLHVSARGDGGTPLIVALFWGHREMAEVLAGHGVTPPNLRAAAGLGRAQLIDELVGPRGTLASTAGAGRGFYRPHGGFPAWRRDDADQQVLDEALSWAARNDRADALELLVARGASIDADVYRGTALAWAAAGGHVDSVRRLLALGADPNARTSFGGPDHGERATALHVAAQNGHIDTIDVLIQAGADPTIRDARHDGTPAGWAQHGRQTAALALLRDHGG